MLLFCVCDAVLLNLRRPVLLRDTAKAKRGISEVYKILVGMNPTPARRKLLIQISHSCKLA